MAIDPSCFFQRLFAQFYVATETEVAGYLAIVLPKDVQENCISFQDATQSTSLLASFLYSAEVPQVTAALAAQIVAQTLTLAQTVGSQRVMAFPTDWTSIRKDNTANFGLADDATQMRSGLVAPIFPTLNLSINSGAMLTPDFTNNTWSFVGQGNVFFGGASAPTLPFVAEPMLSFSGTNRGLITFGTAIARSVLGGSSSASGWAWGFQYLIPSATQANGSQAANTAGAYVWEWLPLADPVSPASTDQLGFNVALDSSDPLNVHTTGTIGQAMAPRTALWFTGVNFSSGPLPTLLVSNFSTNLGTPVYFRPVVSSPGTMAALVFNAGVISSSGALQNFQVAPYGDFTLSVNLDPSTTAEGSIDGLMGGLQGTEYFGFQPTTASYPGDRIRFAWGMPAYAAGYPYPPSSAVGPQPQVGPLLQVVQTEGNPFFGATSWATMLRNPGAAGHIAYLAQPNGSALYGLVASSPAFVFGMKDPCVCFADPSIYFPLAPYRQVVAGDGVTQMNAQQITTIESKVISPSRRTAIGQPSGSAAVVDCITGTAGTGYNATTPSSTIVTLDGGGTWKKVFLARNLNQTTSGEPDRQLAFCMPQKPLQQALQTNDLLLVAANATYLGAPAGETVTDCDPSGSTPAFVDTMNIDRWVFEAKVGQQNVYGDYRDVFIFKGTAGPLYDPAGDPNLNLVANPQKWTMAEDFSVPQNVQSGDPAPTGDLVALSQWLQDYFAAAAAQTDDSFATFNRIAKDPYWTGILILRMTMLEMPTELAGLKAGMADPSLLNAHHFGIEISRVTPDVTPANESTSMFGLIYYVDPQFVPPANAGEAEPVPPAAGSDYDFRLLMLKVLFQNTAVATFESYAQLTINNLMGMTVDHMGAAGGNAYNTILLTGSYQNNNGQPVYGLSNISDSSTFFFLNDVFNKIEITTASMTTRSYDPNGNTVSVFGLTGFFDFATLQALDQNNTPFAFDVFSFGSVDGGETSTRQGLSFSNLGIVMTFPSQAPTTHTFAFDSSDIRFDVTTSTPRPLSLFLQFALTLQGLNGGTAETPPADVGFSQLITDARLTGVDGQPWYGLKYQLNLGTPGALAGKAGLTSYLVTAWTPEGEPADPDNPSYTAYVGLELPGMKGSAKLLSLQNVLRLSIGAMILTLDRVTHPDSPSFLLELTTIALQILGLLKVPTGGTNTFYLFGNPNGASQPSGLGWYAMYNQDQPAGPQSTRSERI